MGAWLEMWRTLLRQETSAFSSSLSEGPRRSHKKAKEDATMVLREDATMVQREDATMVLREEAAVILREYATMVLREDAAVERQQYLGCCHVRWPHPCNPRC